MLLVWDRNLFLGTNRSCREIKQPLHVYKQEAPDMEPE